MNKEKQTDKLMKQGRGLAAMAVILIVLAVFLIALLADMSFVPQGEDWEECKASMTSYFLIDDPTDEVTRYSDKEMWDRIKTEMKETGLVPFKSGFLCWGTFLISKAREQVRVAELEESIRLSQETAESLMETFDGFISEKEMSFDTPMTVYVHIGGKRTDLSYMSDDFSEFFSEEDEAELKERLWSVLPDKNRAAAEVILYGEKCTATVYAPDVDSILEGTDFPYFDENGHFDEEQIWGYGLSEVHNNGFIIGYVDENGVKP